MLPFWRLAEDMSMEKKNHAQSRSKAVWDCDSTLYDSFELKSFNRQLDSAIASRSYSMPHLSGPAPPPPPAAETKKPSKVSKSLRRFLRALFRVKPRSGVRPRGYGYMGDGYHGLQPSYGALATIPEACERDAVGSPELRSTLGKSVSERYTGKAEPAAGSRALGATTRTAEART